MTSRIRQNFSHEVEDIVNKLINAELSANYIYLSMEAYFDRDDVALKGLSKYCCEMAKAEMKNYNLLTSFQNLRGGEIKLEVINKPPKDKWGTALDSMKFSLQLQTTLLNSYNEFHSVASKHKDPHTTDFIETEFLEAKVAVIKKIGDYITKLIRAGPGLGEYIFDAEEFENS